MCDTLVALGNSTLDGSVIFGKNSDRPQTESQLITYSPRIKYSKGEQVKCTYISIPQASETYAIILSQPWWMWGAEMGVNEYGVVIGNEAVHTYEPLNESGLLGMDLLRLGLERGKTASQALDIIINLLEKYGQGGGCAYDDPTWMYHNSYIIADSKEAYVLETAGEWWILEKVMDVRSISNGLTITGKGDTRKLGIIEHAIENGYCKDDDDFDFSFTFGGINPSNQRSTYFRGGKSRMLLNNYKGRITPELMMSILREHEAGICMHGGFESTGSQISHLKDTNNCSVHWFTGTTLPCLSVYKPYNFPVEGQYILNSGPYSARNEDWIWIKHSHYLKNLTNYINNYEIKSYISSIRNMEQEFLRKVKELQNDECRRDYDSFNNQIRIINQEIWEKTKAIL